MYKLLVIVDEMLERKISCRELQKQLGNLCEIYEAKDGNEVVEIFKREKIQAAFLMKAEHSISETECSSLSKIKKRMEQYIQKHYMEEISVHYLAEQMNYSEAYFCKLFKQCFGMNFTSYLAQYRVKEAKKLLKTSSMNVKEIGKVCGYPTPCYFTRVFKREAGCTPLEYRIRYMNDEIE